MGIFFLITREYKIAKVGKSLVLDYQNEEVRNGEKWKEEVTGSKIRRQTGSNRGKGQRCSIDMSKPQSHQYCKYGIQTMKTKMDNSSKNEATGARVIVQCVGH